MDLVRAFYMVVILHGLLDSGMYIVNNFSKKGGDDMIGLNCKLFTHLRINHLISPI